jgi:hypothetical protein
VSQRMIKVAHDPGDAQITSHCPFCGSGQIIGRSDGNIECEFCGMAYLVRVQPMFTGMPGNPAGPGFGGDTSMAPDLMAPEAIGPDGEPVMGQPGMEGTPGDQMADQAMMMGGGPTVPGGMGAMMPGDEGAAEDEGFPPEEGGEDEEGGPPPEEGEDSEESGPPPKSKSKKKGSRLYTTVAGDQLPEDAYIRHLAALHGGIAVLRRSA